MLKFSWYVLWSTVLIVTPMPVLAIAAAIASFGFSSE